MDNFMHNVHWTMFISFLAAIFEHSGCQKCPRLRVWVSSVQQAPPMQELLYSNPHNNVSKNVSHVYCCMCPMYSMYKILRIRCILSDVFYLMYPMLSISSHPLQLIPSRDSIWQHIPGYWMYRCKLILLSKGTITKESCNWIEFISVVQCPTESVATQISRLQPSTICMTRLYAHWNAVSSSCVATIFGPPANYYSFGPLAKRLRRLFLSGGPLAGPFSLAGPPVVGPAGPSLRHWCQVKDTICDSLVVASSWGCRRSQRVCWSPCNVFSLDV